MGKIAGILPEHWNDQLLADTAKRKIDGAKKGKKDMPNGHNLIRREILKKEASVGSAAANNALKIRDTNATNPNRMTEL